MHPGQFGFFTKLGAKRAELVQKFVPRSRVGIFHNKHTRSTPCDHKLMFWCIRTIWGHSGPFGGLTKLGAKRAVLVPKFVPRSRVEIFRNERTRSTPLDPKLIFRCVSYNFGALGTVWLSYITRWKTVVMVQKFVPRIRVGIFRNECTRFTPLDPEKMFWCIS